MFCVWWGILRSTVLANLKYATQNYSLWSPCGTLLGWALCMAVLEQRQNQTCSFLLHLFLPPPPVSSWVQCLKWRERLGLVVTSLSAAAFLNPTETLKWQTKAWAAPKLGMPPHPRGEGLRGLSAVLTCRPREPWCLLSFLLPPTSFPYVVPVYMTDLLP